MPLYEFLCHDCGGRFEELVRGQEQVLCPACQAKNVERLLSAPAAAHLSSLPTLSQGCPPPSHGPCGPGCCRLP